MNIMPICAGDILNWLIFVFVAGKQSQTFQTPYWLV